MYSTYRAPSAQRRFLLVFFGKSVEAVVIFRGGVDQSRIWLLDSSLAQFRPYARRVPLDVARELDQCAACFRAHSRSIPRSPAAADCCPKRTRWKAVLLSRHVNFRNCAENVIVSPVADEGYAEPPVNSAPPEPVV